MNKINSVVHILVILILAILSGKMITSVKPLLLVLAAIAVLCVIIILIKPEYGLIFLLFSMMLSPEITPFAKSGGLYHIRTSHRHE